MLIVHVYGKKMMVIAALYAPTNIERYDSRQNGDKCSNSDIDYTKRVQEYDMLCSEHMIYDIEPMDKNRWGIRAIQTFK